jgi:hypothetical protein
MDETGENNTVEAVFQILPENNLKCLDWGLVPSDSLSNLTIEENLGLIYRSASILNRVNMLISILVHL